MGIAFNTHGEKRNACTLLARRAEGKREVGRPRLRWTAFRRRGRARE
jgi:hypothetical protein